MSLRVVPAQQSDTPALMRLHLEVLAEERWFITSTSEYTHDPFSLLEHLKDLLREENSGWWVAWEDGAIVGFSTATGGHLDRIRHLARFEVMVRKSARRQGVGKALTEAVVAWAQGNPVVAKLSLAVFDDNERAIGLYKSLGFVEEGRRPGEYREPNGGLRGDVLMALAV